MIRLSSLFPGSPEEIEIPTLKCQGHAFQVLSVNFPTSISGKIKNLIGLSRAPMNNLRVDYERPVPYPLLMAYQIKRLIDTIPPHLPDGWMKFESPEGKFSGLITLGKPAGIVLITVPLGEYEGEVEEGNPKGKGVMRTPFGHIECTYVNGLCHGIGKEILLGGEVDKCKNAGGYVDMSKLVKLPLKEKYVGDYQFGKYHGKGKYCYGDGKVYEGDWVNGLRQGNGIAVEANGDVYEGEWQRGMRWGKGKYSWVDGDVYEGDWKNDKRHGQGKYSSADGDVYEGPYTDDLRGTGWQDSYEDHYDFFQRQYRNT